MFISALLKPLVRKVAFGLSDRVACSSLAGTRSLVNPHYCPGLDLRYPPSLGDFQFLSRVDQCRINEIIGVDDSLRVDTVYTSDLPDPLTRFDHMHNV